MMIAVVNHRLGNSYYLSGLGLAEYLCDGRHSPNIFADQVQQKNYVKSIDIFLSSQDFKKVPKWLSLNRQYVPDLVVEDPKKAPVWEITGTEFSKSEAHTADGISIRFPRVTKIRLVTNRQLSGTANGVFIWSINIPLNPVGKHDHYSRAP